MSAAAQEKPYDHVRYGYKVGEEGIYVVGLKGIVTALTPESIVIENIPMPRAIMPPVRYMSMIWPDDAEPSWDDEEATVPKGDLEDAERARDALAAAIEQEHGRAHEGVFRWCSNPLCREVRA